MIDPRTLRGKLAAVYAATLLLSLVAFAGGTLWLVHQMRVTTLDERLDTAARALIALGEVRSGRLMLSSAAHARFMRIVGPRLDGAIVRPDGSVAATTVVSLPRAVRALAEEVPGRTRVVTLRSAGDPEAQLRAAFTSVPSLDRPRGVAVVWRSLDGIADIDRRLTLIFALAIPLVAGFAIAAGTIIANRGLRPLESLATVASEIEASDLSRRIGAQNRRDEIGRLCAIFDRMLDRLEQAFDLQRQFASDASHELRTPLAVIRAEAEFALRHPRSNEDAQRAFRTIADHADALEELTSGMLAMARAEAVDDSEPGTELASVARAVAAQLGALARAREITIVVRDADPAPVELGFSAAARALTCVLHNALTFSPAASTITIDVVRTGAAVCVSVTDDGPGFSPRALRHALERFWRDDEARSERQGGGTGLGLAIADAVVRGAGGRVELRNAPGRGACVLVELPVADVSRSSDVHLAARPSTGGARTS